MSQAGGGGGGVNSWRLVKDFEPGQVPACFITASGVSKSKIKSVEGTLPPSWDIQEG